MTRRDYIAIAETVKQAVYDEKNGLNSLAIIQDLADKLCRIMAADNERFDRVKFLEACGL